MKSHHIIVLAIVAVVIYVVWKRMQAGKVTAGGSGA